jgi:hypothetical protein
MNFHQSILACAVGTILFFSPVLASAQSAQPIRASHPSSTVQSAGQDTSLPLAAEELFASFGSFIVHLLGNIHLFGNVHLGSITPTYSLGGGGGGGDSGNPGITDQYGTTWHDLRIGGGGYIRGMDIVADGTKVARTDSYGAYVWNGSAWQQLISSSTMPTAEINLGNNGGIYEIRIAPSNTNIFYMMFNGAIYVSTNKGTSWTQTAFSPSTPEPCCTANDNFAQNGEKMAIDPANSNVVYAGTEASGLWVTTNGGSSWSHVASSSVPMGLDSGGMTGIAPDPSSGTTGGKTNTIYVGSWGNGVYESTNAGVSWSYLSGGPSSVTNAEVENGIYYAVDDTNAWKYSGGTWTEILAGAEAHSIAVDPGNAQHIVLANGGGGLNQSFDGGATWSGQEAGTRVATDVPWLAWTNEDYMTNGNMIFDPTGSDKLYFAEGIGVWYSNPPSSNIAFNWYSQSAGIEQLVANEVISPPGGHPLVASWDRPVFTITNPDVYPSTHGPNNDNAIILGFGLDWASNNPSYIAGVMMDVGEAYESSYSTDGGVTWTNFGSQPDDVASDFHIGGNIAVASSTDMVWITGNGGQPYYSKDGGNTWTATDPPGTSSQDAGWGYAYYLRRFILAADRVNIGTFYAYNTNDGVYRSTDGGVTWTLVHSGQLIPFDTYNAELESVPNEAGNLFFCAGSASGQTLTNSGGQAFVRSTDGGATWTAVPNVLGVLTFGFGAPAISGGYPTIYIAGWVNGVYGIWRSTDNASTWAQIGLWPINSLDAVETVSGDMNTYGRVYVGFGGSGYAYGDTSDAAPWVDFTAPTPTATVDGSSVTLSATSSGAVAITTVQFKVGNTNIGSAISSPPYTTTWNSTGVSDGAHTLYAVAHGPSGYATSSVPIIVQNTPPVISSIASTTAQASTTITWTTNDSANSKVVYGLTTAYGSASSNASFVTSHVISLTGLASSTVYHFAVVSSDNLGNTSTSSDQTFLTTPPYTTPPSTPTNLTATATSTSEIDLSWTASTSTVGIASYQVFRNSVQVATSTLTSYADTGLIEATNYSYVVKAVDTVGNISASSSAATATTNSGVSFTPTANPAGISQFTNVFDFGTQSIGTPASTRVVVVGVASNATGNLSSVTIGGTPATEAANPGNPAGNSWTSIWYAPITSGSTADITATYSSGTIGNVIIMVGILTGTSSAPYDSESTVTDGCGSPSSVTATVPTNGVGVAVGLYSGASKSIAWTGSTNDPNGDYYTTDSGGNGLSAGWAHTYTSGSHTMSFPTPGCPNDGESLTTWGP